MTIRSEEVGTGIKQRIQHFEPGVMLEDARVVLPDALRGLADEMGVTLKQRISRFQPEMIVEDIGTVLLVSDGIARVRGLREAMAGELLQFPGQLVGMALNLDEDSIGCVLLGSYDHVREGDEVRRTRQIVQVPVGEALIIS